MANGDRRGARNTYGTPILVAILLMCVPGCAGWRRTRGPAPAARPAAPAESELRLSAQREFAQAVYLKPRGLLPMDRTGALAPLIVREVEWDPSPALAHALSDPDDGDTAHVWMDPAPATEDGWRERYGYLQRVYGGVEQVVIGGVEHERVTYVWEATKRRSHEATKGEGENRRVEKSETRNLGDVSFDNRQSTIANQNVYMGGVRITLGLDGFPVVWEVLDSREERVRVLFVSRSAEWLAARTLGGPLPGRQFALERAVLETPGTIVVRTIEDGPAPMGPYVYVRDADDRISTVLCRCSPAQAGEFVREETYELIPWDQLEAEVAVLIPAPAELTKVLRWPEGL